MSAHKWTYSLLVGLVFGLQACDPQRVFDDNKLINGEAWYYKTTFPFEVQITDTQAYYNVYVNLRVNADYKYSNIFLWLNTTNPDRKTDKRRVEIKLADESGKWLGSGLGDLYDYQFPVYQKVRFPHSGFYRFEVEQNMREDTLQHIKAVGVRVEKTR
ncbi:MAG: gliding motility lipoprotein GldH [Bacteroidia bacterium]|jgi:gliding motility-associated lipoprotein GldH|nr:gliding motility lipoprotein GldH [Bacteroidia bacterium]